MRIKTVTIAVLAALCLFQAVLAQNDDAAGADDAGDDEDSTTAGPEPTEPPVFDIELFHTGSDTNEIDINWISHSSFNDDVKRYYITAQKKGSENMLTSPDMESDVREFLIEDLVHESDYEICLYAEMKNGTLIDTCDDYFTIPFVRDDSLIVLFCVLGYIFLMILIGYLCWSYAKKKAEAEYEEEEEEEEEEKGNAALLA